MSDGVCELFSDFGVSERIASQGGSLRVIAVIGNK